MAAMLHGIDWWATICIGMLLSVPVRNLWRQRGVGPVLLDIGFSDDHYDLLICGLLAVTGLVAIIRGGNPVFSALLGLLGTGIGFIAWKTERVQLRGAGFWRGNGLIPWHQIEAYEITPTGSLSLEVQGNRRFCCDVPAAVRQQAADLLASKCRTDRRSVPDADQPQSTR
jgi:hypothetical protein